MKGTVDGYAVAKLGIFEYGLSIRDGQRRATSTLSCVIVFFQGRDSCRIMKNISFMSCQGLR